MMPPSCDAYGHEWVMLGNVDNDDTDEDDENDDDVDEEDLDDDEDLDDEDEDVSTCAMLIWLSGLTCVTPILSKLAPTLSSNHLAQSSMQ